MKFLIAFALIAAVAADVSHLTNNMYLPPVLAHHAHHVGPSASAGVGSGAGHADGFGAGFGAGHADGFGAGFGAGHADGFGAGFGAVSADGFGAGFGAGEVAGHAQGFGGSFDAAFNVGDNGVSVGAGPGVGAAFAEHHVEFQGNDITQNIGADTFAPSHLPEQHATLGGDESSYGPQQEQHHEAPAPVAPEQPAEPAAPEYHPAPAPALGPNQLNYVADVPAHAPVAPAPAAPAPVAHAPVESYAEAPQEEAHVHEVSSGIETQYGSNGGYIY